MEYDSAHPPKLLFLNSANAKYVPGEAMYIFDFNETLQCPPEHTFLLTVLDAQIPYSWYQINANNNRYYVNGTLHTIPEGNYNILELLDQLRFIHPTFTFAYKETTNRVTIAAPTPFSIANDTSFQPFLRMLGFRKDIYSDSASYTSDSVVNLSGYNSIYLYANLTSYNLDSYAKRGSNAIARVPVTAVSNGIIFYSQPAGAVRQQISQQSVSEIKLQLLDSLYFPLFLNHVDWSVTLQIETIRTVEEEVQRKKKS